jgi:membrane protein DedA with SNARE-associated domain
VYDKNVITMLQTFYQTLVAWVESDTVLLGALAAFVVTFLTGESGGIIVLTYAHSGTINIPVALTFVFLGSLCTDIFWYIISACTFKPWLEKRLKIKGPDAQEIKKLPLPIMEYSKQHPYVTLLLSKFLFGMRLVLTIYIATRKDISFNQYLICNILANILFVAVLHGIAYFIYQGTGQAFDIKNNLFHAMTLILLVVIGSQILLRINGALISRYLSKSLK